MKNYDPKKIEPYWQSIWEKSKIYEAQDFSEKPKFYVLVEFPYPSGEGLHVGHVRSYSALDAVARYKRMLGFNVLYPMGWDAFGLPTENFAIKTKTHPRTVTDKNVANFRKQMKKLGLSFDWSREVDTTDPTYYKWTQWIFLQLYNAGLAYRSEIAINWCPFEKTGLANEEVVEGKHERCGTEVTKKNVLQWVLKITEYADRLIDDLELVDYPERVKAQQVNWIGKSVGAEVDFEVAESAEKITVFTTRPDTLFGATYLVLAPEHPFVNSLLKIAEVKKYVEKTKSKSNIERQEAKEKTGVFTGVHAVNPVNGEKIPIWIADYVLPDYGTGAIMAVPAHDERDFEFAIKFKLPLTQVIKIEKAELPFADEGAMMNSGEFNGMSSSEAREKITKWLVSKKVGKEKVNYKLRDWIFSRQHYWGEPIPIIHCEDDGEVPVPEKDLPVVLPEVEAYEPTETGESPLAKITDWVNTKCPTCGKKAKRETDTMPNWAGSSWYFLRYTDPKNDKEFADRGMLDYWTPVDLYNGGMEHTTLHLLYSRFWHKFLFDKGFVRDPEPYKKRTSHGFVLGPDNQKMSKSRGNVINPDDVVSDYGADTMRVYEMFMAPFEQMTSWDDRAIAGVYRFLNRVYKLVEEIVESVPLKVVKQRVAENAILETEILQKFHKTVKKVTEDLGEMRFNTAVASLMEFTNKIYEIKDKLAISSSPEIYSEISRGLVLLLNPFAPHLSSELWDILGENTAIETTHWPKFEEKYLQSEFVSIVVQVNGKVRGEVLMEAGSNQEQVEQEAIKLENVIKFIGESKPKKIIFVNDKLINFVI